MEKKSVVRLQLLALAGITVLLLVRVVSGPPSPDGLVVMDRLEDWAARGAQEKAELDWMRRHALRTLVKAGDGRAPSPGAG